MAECRPRAAVPPTNLIRHHSPFQTVPVYVPIQNKSPFFDEHQKKVFRV